MAKKKEAPEQELALTLKRESTEAAEALSAFRVFEIASAHDAEQAGEWLRDVKAKWQSLEEQKKKATRPMNEALTEIRSWFKPPQDFYAQLETLIKLKLSEFHARLERERRAALKAAEVAVQEGSRQEVEVALAKVEETEQPTHPGVNYRQRWTFEVVDLDKVPRAYLCLDGVKVRTSVNGGTREIPGLRIYQETVVAASAG